MDATNARARSDASYATIANANVISVGWKLCIPGPLTNDAPAVAARSCEAPPTPTVSPTPVAAPTPPRVSFRSEDMHPLQIEYMRRRSYPGSDIVIEEVLAPGVNYSRYVVVLPSEGNKIFALLTVPVGTKPATGWPVITL